MRIIKRLADDISCNIREAEDKIETAYRLKAEYPTEAAWYREMASAHLAFNTKAHEMVKAQIDKYKTSEHHKEHPEYADGMMAVWNDKHAEVTAWSARVKAMIDAWK